MLEHSDTQLEHRKMFHSPLAPAVARMAGLNMPELLLLMYIRYM